MTFGEMEANSFSNIYDDDQDYMDNHAVLPTPPSIGQPDRGLFVVFSSTTPFRPPLVPLTTHHFRENMRCDQIDTNYQMLPSIISCFCLLFGFVYCFFGYRYFKISMFGTGFWFASLVTYIICHEENYLPLGGKLGVAMGAGVLCGLITMLVLHVGLFMTGFHLGFLLAVAGLVVAEMFVSVNSKWVPICSVMGVGLVNAVLCLKFQKALTIFSTAMVGAVMMFVALDFVIDQLGFFYFSLDRLKAVRSPLLCWFTWFIVTTIPFFALLGAVLQFQVTGRHCNHRDNISLRRALNIPHQLTNQNTLSQRANKALKNHEQNLSHHEIHALKEKKRFKKQHKPHSNMKQNGHHSSSKTPPSYQHLHKSRRSNGDILSKNFVCRIHEGISPNRPVSIVG